MFYIFLIVKEFHEKTKTNKKKSSYQQELSE